jgi:hypothetical protein
MADYRLYCLDGANKITSAENIPAQSDQAAIAIARARKMHTPCELWCSNRLVAKIPAQLP